MWEYRGRGELLSILWDRSSTRREAMHRNDSLRAGGRQ